MKLYREVVHLFCAQILDVDAYILEVQMPHVEICAFVLDTDPCFQGCGNLVYSGVTEKSVTSCLYALSRPFPKFLTTSWVMTGRVF